MAKIYSKEPCPGAVGLGELAIPAQTMLADVAPPAPRPAKVAPVPEPMAVAAPVVAVAPPPIARSSRWLRQPRR